MLHLIILLISMLFSAYFSGMEIAFVSSNKMRFEMDRSENNNGIINRILAMFYRHPNTYISTMLVGNNIALVVYGIVSAQLIDAYIIGAIWD
ncbi:MAG: DUF21 domain-containing protein, partial [Bacteroidales bacterium]|nr:DUF21 domain-containing protein [Candidatus Minthousia equi]